MDKIRFFRHPTQFMNVTKQHLQATKIFRIVYAIRAYENALSRLSKYDDKHA